PDSRLPLEGSGGCHRPVDNLHYRPYDQRFGASDYLHARYLHQSPEYRNSPLGLAGQWLCRSRHMGWLHALSWRGSRRHLGAGLAIRHLDDEQRLRLIALSQVLPYLAAYRTLKPDLDFGFARRPSRPVAYRS